MNILPTRNRGSERDTWRALVGLEGDFEAAGRSFYWSVTASRGKSTGYVEVFDSYATHLNHALDSVRANGETVCRINADADPTNDAAACAPLDPFGHVQALPSPSSEDRRV